MHDVRDTILLQQIQRGRDGGPVHAIHHILGERVVATAHTERPNLSAVRDPDIPLLQLDDSSF